MKYVDIHADWCMPCKIMEPILHEIETECDINFERIDADKNQDFIIENDIKGIPTLIVFDGDKEVNRIIGYRSKKQLIAELGL